MSYDANARRQTPLAVRLASEIAASGPMPLATFMSRCLWDGQHGYYANKQPLGSSGDFTTAPEISQVFGELIGLWAAVVWRDALGSPSPFTLAELGPGRGTLMRDALRVAAKVRGFKEAAHCHLVEKSLPLIDAQRRLLGSTATPLSWSPDAGAIAKPAIIIANEFFDALPVRQWIMTDDGWRERAVNVDAAGDLVLDHLITAGSGVLETVAANEASADAVLEHREIDDLLKPLAQEGAAVLLVIDYGNKTSRLGDSLQAVRNHRYEHILTSPGEADLSSHVDFEAFAHAAKRANLAVQGPVTQAEFLGQLGIVERTQALMAANPGKAAAIEIATARLISPDAMGSLFKVMAVCSPHLPALPGFEQDRRGTRR